MDVAAPSGPSNRSVSLTRAIEQLLQSHFEDTNEYVIARISGSGDISKNEWTVEARGGPKSDTRCFLEIDNETKPHTEQHQRAKTLLRQAADLQLGELETSKPDARLCVLYGKIAELLLALSRANHVHCWGDRCYCLYWTSTPDLESCIGDGFVFSFLSRKVFTQGKAMGGMGPFLLDPLFQITFE